MSFFDGYLEFRVNGASSRMFLCPDDKEPGEYQTILVTMNEESYWMDSRSVRDLIETLRCALPKKKTKRPLPLRPSRSRGDEI